MFSECQSLPISRNSVFTHDTINQKNFMFKCSTVTRLFALMDCSQILPFVNQLLRERKNSMKITLINNVPQTSTNTLQMDESPTTSLDTNTVVKCNHMHPQTIAPVAPNSNEEKNDTTLVDTTIVISDDNDDVRKPRRLLNASTSSNKPNFSKTEVIDLKNEKSGSFVLGASPRSVDESTSSLRKLFVLFT